MGFRARVRIRVAKSFTTDRTNLELVVGGRSVRMVGGLRAQKLSEAKWLVLSAGPFDTELMAWAFGNELRDRLEIASFACRVGMDGGNDEATSWIDEDWARSSKLIKPEERILPNTHGVAVIPDDDLIRFPVIDASGTVTTDPEMFLRAVDETSGPLKDASLSMTAVRLINQAFMAAEPLAQLVLAFSAIEELGQGERWSAEQQDILVELAEMVEEGGKDSQARGEIGTAIRSLHRLSLRQGVLRVLARLDVGHLKADWDRLYGIRSGIFHGTARLSQADIHSYANDVLTLCGKIVAAQLRSEGIEPPQITDVSYPAS